MEEFEVQLPSGEVLKGYHWPAENAVANLTMITGMQEYAARYDRLGKYLNTRGINFWCLDALGQGRNVDSVENLQKWPKFGFSKNVDAVKLMVDLAKANGLPTTQMGHSMGSFITQSLIERYPHCADKVILCGSNGGQAGLMKFGFMTASLVVHRSNWDKPNGFLTSLSLGGYAKAVKNRKTDVDWLSYNEQNVQDYIKDPYCGHPNTGGFWVEFMRGMRDIWTKKAMSNISKDDNIFIIAGAEDPVGQNGKGPKWLLDAYKKYGVEKVELKLYEHMRHEIHNEDDYMTVYNDIAEFILK